MVGRDLRFSCNDQTVEVIKLFIIWHQQQLPFALFLQARNRPVGIMGEGCPTIQSQLANQSAHYSGYKHKPYNN